MEADLTVDRLTRADTPRPKTGIVHLGLGAFFRGFGCVYTADAMTASGGDWGIIGVSLRSPAVHDALAPQGWAYNSVMLAPEGAKTRVIDILNDVLIAPEDPGAVLAAMTEADVKIVSLTVTEKGYCHNPATGALNPNHPDILHDLTHPLPVSAPGFLVRALQMRREAGLAPFTVLTCDNLPENGKLVRGVVLDLARRIDPALADWIAEQGRFPATMVDRITPRSPASLAAEMTALIGSPVSAPIMAEDFVQWVLLDTSAAAMPDLARVGVTVTADVDPYEETKIRVLNGGHTALVYLAALEGVITFDAAMRVPHLAAHFQGFETTEVLPALTLDLPFSKQDYLADIIRRFGNQAIGDTVARISADGMAKFPTFIRPTLAGCLAQGITPVFTIHSIASWYVFARHVAAGKIPFEYLEPSWDALLALLGTDDFVTSPRLWGDIPQTYPIFADTLRQAISELELKWPV